MSASCGRMLNLTGQTCRPVASTAPARCTNSSPRHKLANAHRTVASAAGQAVGHVASEAPARWEGVTEGTWMWKGHKIRYQRSGEAGPPVLMVHGFGGNCDHWRLNTPEVGTWGRAFSIDLLGYGYSDKPTPKGQPPNTIYNFENWADQLEAFIDEVIGEPAYVTSNSVGGLAALQVSVQAPTKVKGVQLMNISLRQLHLSKQNKLARPFVATLQKFLRESSAGEFFFKNLASPRSVKSVLQQAYCNPDAVTDELVDCILKPGFETGAVDVFLDFISYSSGPLPEDLIPKCPVPLDILWGAADPWELVAWGRVLADDPNVQKYTELPGVGHCPQDEAPAVVNPLIKDFVMRNA